MLKMLNGFSSKELTYKIVLLTFFGIAGMGGMLIALSRIRKTIP